VGFGDIFMTGVAVTVGRIDYQLYVSGSFIVLATITTVTDDTAHLTMSTLHELGIINEDLFPGLQRRQISASAFACGFPGYGLFCGDSQFFEDGFIGVAGNTAIGCLFSSIRPWSYNVLICTSESDQGNQNNNDGNGKNQFFQ
jgi:hypothetical protein